MSSPAKPVFRELCAQYGLAVTHQRQVIYEVMCSMHGHPSPEDVYHRVREQVPAISLATVYKNIHIFLSSGILREVSPHHGSLRVEMNSHPHHHLVCTRCRSIDDLGEEFLGSLPTGGTMANGFLVERLSVDVLGLCTRCQAELSVAEIRQPETNQAMQPA